MSSGTERRRDVPPRPPSWIIHHVCGGCNLKEQEQLGVFLLRIQRSVLLLVTHLSAAELRSPG